MRVLLISHTYMPRVNQRKLYELCNAPEIALQVLVPQEWSEPNRFDLRAEIPASAPFRYTALPTVFAPHINRFFFRSLDLTLRHFQPDLIHVEESETGLCLAQVLAYRRLWSPRARVVFFTWQNISTARKSFLHSIVARYNLHRADWAIAGNQDAATLLRRAGMGDRISVIPQLGIDTQVFQPGDGTRQRNALDIPTKTFVLGYASRMVPEKGAGLLVEAAARLAGDWMLLLIGKGPEQARVLKRAEALGVRQRVRAIDSVAHLDLPRYLRAMDVLVLPSRSTPTWKEQFAGGLLEAMACGTIAVGSTCGEIPNVIGDSGIVFPESDVSALADALGKLQNDPALRTRLRERGLALVQTNYTWSEIARQTSAVWSNLLGSNG